MITATSTEECFYEGPDRRHNRVFITDNSEYHCRDGVCVAVRDLDTGAFISDSQAVGRRISASIRFTHDGGIASVHDPNEPALGEKLCFVSGELYDVGNILTSALASIARPTKDDVENYPR
jgi:hypothetical protein